MPTTIQITRSIKEHLDKIKLFERETYNDVIERILEDLQELNEETKKEIERSVAEIERGEYKTHEEVGKEMGL
ncbi:MAG: hypothetical protein V3T58_00410 [Candidatus Hydrothermarchaeales archaeon]